MLRRSWLLGIIVLAGLPAAGGASEATLRGSRAAMIHQNRVAKERDYTFLRTPSQVLAYVAGGQLVPLRGNADYRIADASFPYTRQEVKLFVERIGAQYHASCAQQLVVTSATRPSTHQPRNASPLSVHPAGMAVDLRIPKTSSCRSWLETTLLALEAKGVLDVTRERNPAHYHVAVFTTEYAQYVQVQLADSTRKAKEVAARIAVERAANRAQAQSAAAAPPVVVSTPRGVSRWWLLVGIPLAALFVGLAVNVYLPRTPKAPARSASDENEAELPAEEQRAAA
jgi:hypothetical protein